jgi:hypothetical protein
MSDRFLHGDNSSGVATAGRGRLVLEGRALEEEADVDADADELGVRIERSFLRVNVDATAAGALVRGVLRVDVVDDDTAPFLVGGI